MRKLAGYLREVHERVIRVGREALRKERARIRSEKDIHWGGRRLNAAA